MLKSQFLTTLCKQDYKIFYNNIYSELIISSKSSQSSL